MSMSNNISDYSKEQIIEEIDYLARALVKKPVLPDDLPWVKITDIEPPLRKMVLFRGPSGYGRTPMRYIVGSRDLDYRPLQPYIDYKNDSILDGGEMVTEWTYL